LDLYAIAAAGVLVLHLLLGCIRSSRNPEPAAAALGSHRLIDLRHLARNPGLVLPSDTSRKLAPRPRRDPHVSGRVSAALLGRARLSGCTSIVAGSLRRCRLSVQSRHLRSALPAPTCCALVIVTGHELPQELRIGPAILTPALLSMTGGNESDSREQERLKRIWCWRPLVQNRRICCAQMNGEIRVATCTSSPSSCQWQSCTCLF
jgi:hypothetical protein